MLLDGISLIIACLGQFFFAKFLTASSTFVLGAVVAIGITLLSHMVARAFQKGAPLSMLHYLLCVVAGFVTWAAVPLFCALGYLEEAAGLSITVWKQQIKMDQSWSNQTFARAYEDVARLGLEDMTAHRPPSEGGNFIPLTEPASVERYAQRYANDAAEHWRTHRPLLSRMLWSSQSPSRAAVANDVREHFDSSPQRPYPEARAISLAAGSIEASLRSQAPRLVFWGRLIFVLLVCAVQSVPLLLIAWRAHSEVQPVYFSQGA